MGTNKILINEAIKSLSKDAHAIIIKIHNNAIEAGFIPNIAESNKKPNFYKIEYKKQKKDDPLYILHINGKKWSFRCKLFHINKYENLLHKLNEHTLNQIITSKPCGNGCTAGLMFCYDGKKYVLCRHRIHLHDLTDEDIPSVWNLLKAESKYR